MTMELLESYQSENGKTLNALDFLINNGSHPPMVLASDLLTFCAMACRGAEHEYPTMDMCWGLVATQGTFTGYHVNADGQSPSIV
jgi:hypothetical protein